LSTDTNDLIDSLTRDLKPVRPLPRAWVRALVLSLWALALGFLILDAIHEPRGDLHNALHQNLYLVQGLSMTLAGLMAAYAAFRLSVPDTRVRPPVVVSLVVASVVWLAMIAGELALGGAQIPERAESCFIGLTMAMSLPLILALFMVMRSAPVWRGWAGFAMVLSTGSFGALVMRVMCPSDSPAHLLVWHFLPVAALAVLGIPLGKILLKFRIARK
jgi:hypothetical protein